MLFSLDTVTRMYHSSIRVLTRFYKEHFKNSLHSANYYYVLTNERTSLLKHNWYSVYEYYNISSTYPQVILKSKDQTPKNCCVFNIGVRNEV